MKNNTASAPGRNRMIALIALNAILVALLPAPPAQATESVRVALQDAAVPVVSITDNSIALAAATSDGSPLAADATIFEVDESGKAGGRLVLGTKLADGSSLTSAEVHWSVASAPAGARVTLTEDGADRRQKDKGDLSFSKPGTTDLNWLFDSPGDYQFDFTVRATISRPAPHTLEPPADPETDGSEPAPKADPPVSVDLSPVTASYRVTVTQAEQAEESTPASDEGDQDDETPAIDETEPEPAQAETEAAQAEVEPAEAEATQAETEPAQAEAELTGTETELAQAGPILAAGIGTMDAGGRVSAVLDAGDVRLASRLADGTLSQSLMVVDAEGGYELHDAATTIISIP
ncbi:MAG: hypothetical protein LBI99_03025, partial [Propionibacteriaceae bacterium]|nr:hypothetical protein [Propionibacteriaceae bacterium]